MVHLDLLTFSYTLLKCTIVRDTTVRLFPSSEQKSCRRVGRRQAAASQWWQSCLLLSNSELSLYRRVALFQTSVNYIPQTRIMVICHLHVLLRYHINRPLSLIFYCIYSPDSFWHFHKRIVFIKIMPSLFFFVFITQGYLAEISVNVWTFCL